MKEQVKQLLATLKQEDRLLLQENSGLFTVYDWASALTNPGYLIVMLALARSNQKHE